LVVPAFGHGRVDTNGDHVIAAVVEVLADVIARGQVSARLLADEEPVNEDARGAIDAIELERDAAAEVALGNRERPPVPPDACFREAATNLLVAVARLSAWIKW